MAEPEAAPPVLVLYTGADEAFVRGYFLPALGDTPGAQGIDARDVAATTAGELERVVTACGLIIAVISPAFLADPWSRLSELMASGAAVERDLDLIPLVLEPGPLPLHLRERVGLDFRFRAEWDQQAQRLRDHLARPAPVEAPLPCPYPGMRPFEAAEARTFYGRRAEIDALVGLVSAGEREVYLVGPSGSGKSSLIAAGVMPRLAAQPGAPELVLRTMRPGEAPVRRLAACLDAGALDAAAVAGWAARHPGARLVVFIDQLEELFTVASPAEQAGFAAALRILRGEPRCVLLLAVRADFYAELMQSALWLDGPRRHVDLPALRGAALRAAIERPARTLDVYLERDLVERLLADVADASSVLPLLQETLVQLWSRRRRRRLLTVVEYDALGEGGRSGLAVAISSRADRCLAELTPSQVVIARRLLLRLVSFGEGRPNTRRRQTRRQLAAGEPEPFDGVLCHLVAARLVVMDGDCSDDDLIDLCHDVLITAWSSFAAWVEARRADELRRRQIQASASEWIARGRGAGGLLDAGELALAVAWRKSDAARELGESPEVAALVDASRAALARARRRRRGLLGGAFGGLAAVTVVIALLAISARDQEIAARREADHARRETDRARLLLARSYEEEGRRLLVDDRAQEAVPYLLEARRLGLDDVILRVLFHAAERCLPLIPALEHQDVVNSAAFSPDGTRVVTASNDRTARIWDAATGRPVTAPLEHQDAVNSAAFSPDGTRVVTASEDDTARVWDAATGQPVTRPLAHQGAVYKVAFSPDGTRVVTASADDFSAQVWDVATGEPITGRLEHQLGVLSAEFSPDGTRVLTASADHTARVWDAVTGKPAASPPEQEFAVMSAAFSADGTRIVTANSGGTAQVWDVATGKPVSRELTHDNSVLSAAFSPDGTRVVTASRDKTARVWDAVTGERISFHSRHRGPVWSAMFSLDGKRVVTASDDKTAQVWDAATGEPLTRTFQHQGPVRDAVFSPDGTRVVTASEDQTARVWDATTERPLEFPKLVVSAAFSPDGTRVVITDEDGTVCICDAATGKPVTCPLKRFDAGHVAFSPDGTRVVIESSNSADVWDAMTGRPVTGPLRHQYSLRSATFSPDGTRVVTASSDRTARVWDATTGKPVMGPLKHDDTVLSAAFSPDGARVVTASEDKTARVWDAATGQQIARFQHQRQVVTASFSPDGRRVVSASADRTARVWDATTGEPVAGPLEHRGPLRTVAFSPDGTRVVTASSDRTAQVWDAVTGRPVTSSLEHGGAVVSAAFSPDGTRVVTASDDKTVRVWDATTGKLLLRPLEHHQGLSSAAFSPDGTRVLTMCDDHKARVWDVGPDEGTFAQWSAIARRSPMTRSGSALMRSSLPSVKPGAAR